MDAPKAVTKTTTMPAPRQEDGGEMAGFGGGTGNMEQVKDQVGAVSAIAREEAELKAAIIVAKRFPRNETAAYTKLLKSCERPSFAEEAIYVFPRGGEMIDGPSVDMAREAKRCWGNMRSGIRIVSKDEEYVHLKGWAVDLETNNYAEEEAKFRRLIFRKKGGWIVPDERDERELTNRIGAIAERNSILHVLPPDVIDDAQRQAEETKRKAASGEIKQNRQDAIRRLARFFFELQVTVEMLESFLKHPLDQLTEEEMTKLRGIGKSIRDGNSRPSEYFTSTNTGANAAGEVEGPLSGKTVADAILKDPPAAGEDPIVTKQRELDKAKAAQQGGPSAEEQERIRRREEFDSFALQCSKCPPYTFGTNDAAEMTKHQAEKHPNGNKPAQEKKGGDLFGPKK